MYYLDPVKNFCQVEVQGLYTAASTLINLYPGQAAKLPNPAIEGAFNLVLWNVTDYPNPADDPNREIVRVTGINLSADTVTVLRGQEGIAATTKNKSGKRYFMALVMTAKTIEDLDTKLHDVIAAATFSRANMEVVAGVVDGVNTAFTTAHTFINLEVYVNGLRQHAADFTLNAPNGFTLAVAPVSGDIVAVSYDYTA